MKQHKVVGLKNTALFIDAQTAGFFHSTISSLVTNCDFVRVPVQLHHSFAIPVHTGSYPHAHPVFVFQTNFRGSEKGGSQHRR